MATAIAAEPSGRQNAPPPHALNRYPRLVRNLIRHSTPRRILNLLVVEAELRLGRTAMRGRPYIIFLDPINLCNLRCPLCPTGMQALLRTQGMMELHLFKHTVDEVAPWAFEITLYNWGEPLLHKDIFEMIRYAADKNLATSISSNFNLVRDGDIDRLIDSGLEYLSISIDGATPETYGRYRVRGNFDNVLANVQTLVRRRNERGATHPVVEWQFIVMKHNEHEIEEARRLADEVGVDLITFVPVAMPFHASQEQRKALAPEWFSSLPGFRYDDDATGWSISKGPWRRWFGWGRRFRNLHPGRSTKEDARIWPSRCYHLYRSMTINPGGGVAPCCIVYDEAADTGNIREGVAKLWNNEHYLSSRAEFNANATPALETICTGCDIFAKPARTSEPVRRPRSPLIRPPKSAATRRDAQAAQRDGALINVADSGSER